MKKIVILSAVIYCLISTTAFSMLATKACAKQLVKKNTPKGLRYDSILPPEFPQSKLLVETMEENKRLKQENTLLQRKFDSLLYHGVIIELPEERATMPGKAKDRDFEHGNMNK